DGFCDVGLLFRTAIFVGGQSGIVHSACFSINNSDDVNLQNGGSVSESLTEPFKLKTHPYKCQTINLNSDGFTAVNIRC
ncbi:MAG: hypothetical protein VW579_10555, partial [Verrucomicrobiales bacterium]